ncbi:MAG TPA: helix-turn-helix domain-containing GNAT family N-acetyltransferase [Mycobacteriales bacterium]|jgi:DNA-binding MarR family transcriptional regulator/RimJ/RimL family protein N-acetyltransferase|nr:helix-turn-helix domain-containing GNAT family N-acetyltransferase [Mycobacteriales bacterium]
MSELRDQVVEVREFNRFYTRLIGVLQDGLLDTPHTLAEARIIFELAQSPSGQGIEVAELKRRLDLDAGYLSRILGKLEVADLVGRERSGADARRQVVELTRAGRAAFRQLDRRTVSQLEGVLGELAGADRRRLLGAMRAIRGLLDDSAAERASVVLREPHPGDLGWVISRNGALYAEEYGWDETYEALVARIVADFVGKRDPKRERAWIAEVDGEPAGCVFCVRADARTAKLRLLLVDPRFRGMGIGARLVDEVLAFARRAGYRRITLWTNDVLRSARRIYQRAGFDLVAQERHTSFGKDLVGQDWARDL